MHSVLSLLIDLHVNSNFQRTQVDVQAHSLIACLICNIDMMMKPCLLAECRDCLGSQFTCVSVAGDGEWFTVPVVTTPQFSRYSL